MARRTIDRASIPARQQGAILYIAEQEHHARRIHCSTKSICLGWKVCFHGHYVSLKHHKLGEIQFGSKDIKLTRVISDRRCSGWCLADACHQSIDSQIQRRRLVQSDLEALRYKCVT